MQKIKLVVSLFLILLVQGVYQWTVNQPRDAGPDVPAGKLRSLSFAPFREGYNPLEEIYPIPEHIEEDMRLLADKTESIRTYSSVGGMEPTPDTARKYGLKMIQGAWLGSDLIMNRNEINALIKSANTHPDVVDRVIVGNEVLLRGDMNVDRLIDYIREVKRAVNQPVSYADVWSMYMKYPQLIKEVDFITIHILPYWEDEPISVENAGAHLEKIVKQVEDQARGLAPGKPILIGESGWPSAGRQRGPAIPSVLNAAKYVRGMIQVVNHHGFDYNIVEAFNQPWKSSLEGVVGANWGLLSADRQPVFPLTGPVLEHSQWQSHFLEASLLWLFIAACYFKTLQAMPLLRGALFLILAQMLCVCLIDMWHFLWYTSYNIWQRGYTVIIVILNVALGGLILRRSADILSNAPGILILAERLRLFYFLFIALALFDTYGLAFNGRYMSFPVEQFLIPVVGICALMLFLCIQQRRLNNRILSFDQLTGWNLHTHRDRLIVYFIGFAIVGMIIGETEAFMSSRDFILAHPGFFEGLPVALGYTLHNRQLLAWLACLFILSLSFWRNIDRAAE
ncbi:MAG: glycosyl hydrolase family 17 protein [Methylomonas sp.]|jgi:exo-beta-1,3-glucanase (GH17 family)